MFALPYLHFSHPCVFGSHLSPLYFVLLHSLAGPLQDSKVAICLHLRHGEPVCLDYTIKFRRVSHEVFSDCAVA